MNDTSSFVFAYAFAIAITIAFVMVSANSEIEEFGTEGSITIGRSNEPMISDAGFRGKYYSDEI